MSVATSPVEEQPATPAETLYQFNESPLLARQSQQESNARSYPRRIPLTLKRAKGLYVEDVEGRTFIDCLTGAGTLALTTPVKDRFVQDLFGLLPPALAPEAKIQFCGPTGTDPVEAALKLVRTATGRSTVLSFQGGSRHESGCVEPDGQPGAEEAPGRLARARRAVHAVLLRLPLPVRARLWCTELLPTKKPAGQVTVSGLFQVWSLCCLSGRLREQARSHR